MSCSQEAKYAFKGESLGHPQAGITPSKKGEKRTCQSLIFIELTSQLCLQVACTETRISKAAKDK